MGYSTDFLGHVGIDARLIDDETSLDPVSWVRRLIPQVIRLCGRCGAIG